jgi:TetR/AcrR family transcriptional repressor of nem operon
VTDLAAEPKDAPGEGRPGKRERLVASATKLLHEQGIEGTTLAEIAAAAEVPLGNVYYYFKTRDELVRAVIQSRAAAIDTLLDSLSARPTPQARLKALAHVWGEQSDLVAAHGCPIGSFCTDLNKDGSELAREAAALLERLISWSGEQFRQMGRRDAAKLAVALLAGVQGAAVLADSLNDPGILRQEVRRLERWIESLA